jgi:hypothetical protein
MKRGKALLQTWEGRPDFTGDTGDERGCTQVPSGVGKLIDVMKCKRCGHSVSFPNFADWEHPVFDGPPPSKEKKGYESLCEK